MTPERYPGEKYGQQTITNKLFAYKKLKLITDRNTIATLMKVGMDIRNLPRAFAVPCKMGTG